MTEDRCPVNLATYVEAVERANVEKMDQVLFAWNIKEDERGYAHSYDYVIISVDETMPDIVQSPYITRHFTYKEKPHE